MRFLLKLRCKWYRLKYRSHDWEDVYRPTWLAISMPQTYKCCIVFTTIEDKMKICIIESKEMKN